MIRKILLYENNIKEVENVAVFDDNQDNPQKDIINFITKWQKKRNNMSMHDNGAKMTRRICLLEDNVKIIETPSFFDDGDDNPENDFLTFVYNWERKKNLRLLKAGYEIIGTEILKPKHERTMNLKRALFSLLEIEIIKGFRGKW